LFVTERFEFRADKNMEGALNPKRPLEATPSTASPRKAAAQEREAAAQSAAIAREPLTSPQWQKQPAVAYRRYDGQHFKLGMTFAVIMLVLEDMLEWKSYNPGHARVKKEECWIEEHGPEINGYDCTEILVPDFVTKHGLRDLAISEVLWSEGAEGVGPSDVFFSHCQNLSLHIMLQTLRDALPIYREQLGREPRFFIDLFCIRQCHKKTEFDLAVVRQAIWDTPKLLVELDDAKDDIGSPAPRYLTRSFTVVEVFNAVEKGGGEKKVLVLGPAVKEADTAPWLAAKFHRHKKNIVNSREAQCRIDEEKDKIDRFISGSIGYEELDKVVGAAIADGVIHGQKLAAQTDPSRINIAALVEVQADDLTDRQLQCFCAEHNAPQVVLKINLRDCEKITSVECLCVFEQLQELDLSGCNSISTESLADLARSRPTLQAPGAKQHGGAGFLNDTLSELGRYTDAIKYENEKLENARQSGELQCVQTGGVFRDRAADW
jgi:hypothetical protein